MKYSANLRNATLMIIVMVCGYCFPVKSAEEINHISIMNLIANPGKWNGKKIRISGFLRLEHEGTALYLHQEDYENSLYKNGIWLNIDVTGKTKSFDQCYVLLEGTFDAKDTGHMGLWSGGIKNSKVIVKLPKSSATIYSKVDLIEGVHDFKWENCHIKDIPQEGIKKDSPSQQLYYIKKVTNKGEDGRQESAIIYIRGAYDKCSKITIKNAYWPIEASWISEELILLEVPWARHWGAVYIYDVKARKVIFETGTDDGHYRPASYYK